MVCKRQKSKIGQLFSSRRAFVTYIMFFFYFSYMPNLSTTRRSILIGSLSDSNFVIRAAKVNRSPISFELLRFWEERFIGFHRNYDTSLFEIFVLCIENPDTAKGLRTYILGLCFHTFVCNFDRAEEYYICYTGDFVLKGIVLSGFAAYGREN